MRTTFQSYISKHEIYQLCKKANTGISGDRQIGDHRRDFFFFFFAKSTFTRTFQVIKDSLISFGAHITDTLSIRPHQLRLGWAKSGLSQTFVTSGCLDSMAA